MRVEAPLLAALVVIASVAMPAAAAVTTDRTAQEAYAGTHVSYDVQGDAVVDYTVDGETIVEAVTVESKSEYAQRSDASGGIDLEAVTEIEGLGLEMGASSTTSATVESEGATAIETHDNEDGTFVVTSGDGERLVEARVGGDAEATAESDDRVVVETENGTTGTFIVVGDGNATVNEDGNVSASLAEDAQLVFRESGEERSDDEQRVERMIANGTATAEVYVEEQDGEVVHDAVTYGQETTVEAEQESENTVNVTVDRAESQGKVVVTHVSEAAVDTTESLDVTVDGEAAAQAESASEVRTAATNGDEATYYVSEEASAEGSAAVLVGFDHFSERSAQISGADSSSDDGADGNDGADGDDESENGSGMPGFGVGAAVLALVGAAAIARRARA